MKIVSPTVELLNAPAYADLLALVEQAGRTCYKSEDKIKDGSAEAFIRNILKRGHEAVIEHGSLSRFASPVTGACPTRSSVTGWPPTAKSLLATVTMAGISSARRLQLSNRSFWLRVRPAMISGKTLVKRVRTPTSACWSSAAHRKKLVPACRTA